MDRQRVKLFSVQILNARGYLDPSSLIMIARTYIDVSAKENT
jgi:hypothetical protein